MNMIDRETAQYIVDTVKGVCGKDINFIDERGIIIASTDSSRIDTFHEIGFRVVSEGTACKVSPDEHFFGVQAGVNLPVLYRGKVIAAVGISGDVEEAEKYALLAGKITSILLRERDLEAAGNRERTRIHYMLMALVHQETTDYEALKGFFQENGITDTEVCRMIRIRVTAGGFVHYSESHNPVIQALERTGSRLYTFDYPGEYILLLKDKAFKKAEKILRELADRYGETLAVGVGGCRRLSGIAGSYREAEMAVRAADGKRNFHIYDELGYEMLLGNMPKTVKEQYTARVLEGLAEEDIRLLMTYYGQEMSLQRTCVELNMHKNTLQYRLNRIHNICGRDPRTFRDAVALYTAVCIQMGEIPCRKDPERENG